MVNNCEGCLEKQRQIDQLLEEVQRLKAKRRYQERKDQEGVFGSSTPSSQLPLKANTDQENRNRKGGARSGHKGHGRSAHSQETADEIIPIDVGEICPDCGGRLKLKEVRNRTVIETEPIKPKKVLIISPIRSAFIVTMFSGRRPLAYFPKRSIKKAGTSYNDPVKRENE